MRVEIVPRVEGFAWDAERYERAIQVANAMRPAFVVLGGDMTDDPASGEQLEELQRVTKLLDPEIPMRWVPGNHDAAADTVVPSRESLELYRQRFGPDRYAFGWGSAHFVVVNTTVFDHPENVGGELEEQMAFLELELAKGAEHAAHTVLLGHHPLFVSHADEEDTYWNLPRGVRRRILELVHRYRVRVGFAGHWHRNAVARDGGFEMVISGPVGYPLGADPSGYRIVDVDTDAIRHEYRPL